MNKEEISVMNKLQAAWSNVLVGVRKMYQPVNIQPSDAYQIFKWDSDGAPDEVKFNVDPIVFLVPERADSRSANLYIVISGWLSFEKDSLDGIPLKTKKFGTKIGYFRSKDGTLQHVYGAHYDIDEETLGHPVFHAQMSPQVDFGDRINELYRLEAVTEDNMAPVLSNVRIPTAQMDCFSVITQICADHLVNTNSGQEVKDAFSALKSSCDFFIGAAHRLGYLNTDPAIHCYRSKHWYAPLSSRF